MSRDFNIDDFEDSLKKSVDAFKLYPPQNLWNSLYNNTHPKNRCPSLALCLAIVSLLFSLNWLNMPAALKVRHHSVTTVAAYHPAANNLPVAPAAAARPTINATKSSFPLGINHFLNHRPMTSRACSLFKLPAINPFRLIPLSSHQLPHPMLKVNLCGLLHYPTLHSNAFGLVKSNLKTTPTRFLPAKISSKDLMPALANDAPLKIEKQALEGVLYKPILPQPIAQMEAASNKTSPLSNEEKEWITEYAAYNRRIPKKWLGKLEQQWYFTPSVAFRQMRNPLSPELDINKLVTQHPSIGLEWGMGLSYPIIKGIKIKTGIQFNFTRYNIAAYEHTHPVMTSIAVSNSSTRATMYAERSTTYFNAEGFASKQLHNETFQFSLPVGLDIPLANGHLVTWYLGASVQPTLLLGGKAYLISFDNKNYVKENTMMNRLNLNAGLETFISIKKEGYRLQLGPQIRQQLFTTNSSSYFVQEKLINYGFKVGFSKMVK